jgi:hypothetical protein
MICLESSEVLPRLSGDAQDLIESLSSRKGEVDETKQGQKDAKAPGKQG